ncbi:MAG: hypothetical protein KDA79_13075 [Planctomycetaceae bacterium]|nr:hypothetical protein [Planctomycetaceae bacterium]
MRISNCLPSAAAVILCFASLSSVADARIEAVRGKEYRLTDRHGPWMVMVASFREPPEEMKSKEGLTPQEAADELVFELRRKGIPAYTYSREDELDRVDTFDRLGRERTRVYTAQQGSVCVLAGNYRSSSGDVAKKTLEYIKDFKPQFLSAEDPDFLRQINERQKDSDLRKLKSGGIFRRTPGQPTPLTGAFLTINPLLDPEKVQQTEQDPLVLSLNSGAKYSLLKNTGRYTLIVASSYVKSTTATADAAGRARERKFTLDVDDNLDEAALSSWQLANYLREGNLPLKGIQLPNGQRNLEAYVYHDRYRSIVTVGSFDSPDDPRIAMYRKLFGAKVRTNPQNGRDVLVAEVATLPSKDGRNVKTVIFDPNPQVIEVPQHR